jgi:hypothetical protein
MMPQRRRMTIVMLRFAAADGKVAHPGTIRHQPMLEAQRLRIHPFGGAADRAPGARGVSIFRIIGSRATCADARRREPR